MRQNCWLRHTSSYHPSSVSKVTNQEAGESAIMQPTMAAEASDSAQSSQSKTAQGAAGDIVDGTVLASGEVNYNDKGHQLFLTQRGLKLVATVPADSKTDSVNSANVPVIDVPWREVVCACEPPVKKSKTTPKESKPETAEQGKVFVVHYMVRDPKTNKVQCKKVTLECAQGTADGWIMQIEEKCKEGKPQKLLIIVNPIGGKANARKVLTKRVQPLFALASVELVVKVTERAKHAIEMAKTFDVKSVDGVVVMGGDGMYMEVLHTLTVRKQEEEGVDYNDPDVTLVPPSVCIGIIPTGTGNGASGLFNGVIDVDTAILNIIRGETGRANIFAIYEGQKLIQYAGLLIGNGYFSSWIKRAEDLGWMKTMRYPYILLSHVIGKKKILDLNVEVRKNEQDQNDQEGEAKEKGAEAAGKVSDWSKLGSKQVSAVFCTAATIEGDVNDMMVINPFQPGFDMLLTTESSSLDSLRFIYNFFVHKKSGLDRPYIEWVKNIQGAKIHLADQTTPEGASSSDDLTELTKILDVDGELVTLSKPNFEIRLHSQFLQVFAYPHYFSKENPPS